MPLWKRTLLRSYYQATLPWRRHRARQAARQGRTPVVILTYHRVAADRANSWTITPDEFASHLAWLEPRFEFVSLEEAQNRLRGRSNSRPTVSITFDDGYADNCQLALPLLIRRRIPVTYFVCGAAVLKGEMFAHDLAMGNRFRPNTVDELRALAADGISIGCHTRSHADLAAISDPAILHDEVVTVGEELQQAIRTPVRYLAFPYGQHRHLNPRVFHLAYDAGYDGVCSSYGGYNYPGDDAFHLQRVCVDGSLIRLQNWASIDPVRERRIRRFFYGPEIVPRQAPTRGALHA
ncbi:MAG: polysaccharide deacetylase family protein [Pirellulales bacterium]|nr:polysaccharide deacetylase family protein [Pirellulales bacterium]